SVAWPSSSCPRLSIDRFWTSPLRKSVCVAARKNFGDEASVAAIPRTSASESVDRKRDRRINPRPSSVRRDGNGQRPDAGNGLRSRNFPLAERGAVERVEIAAAAVGLEHGENRRRQRRQELAVDDGAGITAEQLDVERVVAARLVQRPNALFDGSRLRDASLALFRLV